MVLWSIVIYVAVFILSELLAPKPDVEDARPASLGDFQFPTATEDRPVPLIWGTVKFNGPNVVWYGDLKKKAITEKVGGGLFTSGEKVITGYKYKVGIQFGLCRGGSDECELVRVWNNEEVVDETGPFAGGVGGNSFTIDNKKLYGGIEQGQGGISGTMTFFGGREDQTPSTYLSTFQQEGGDTPAYRGMCYAVWEGGYVGTSPNIRPWAFEVRRIPTGLGTTDSLVNGADANPAHVVYEFITDTEWGLGQPAADIDIANFQSVASMLEQEGNGFSFQLESFIQASDLLEELERQMAGKVFIDQETGKWTIALARGGYTVGTLPLIDTSNLISEESFSRGAWEDTINDVKVKFSQRDNDYFVTFAQAQDSANQLIQGAVVAAAPQFPGCKDATLANNLAWRELRILSTPLAKAELTVSREFWNTKLLDVVRWTDATKGLTDVPMRVTKVDLGQLADGKIRMTLIEDIFAYAEPSFGDPFGTGWEPPGDTLVAIPSNESVIIDAPRNFLIKDPDFIGNPTSDDVLPAKVWCGFHPQVDESGALIRESNDMTTPNATFAAAGTVAFTTEIGTLLSDIGITSGTSTTITVVPSISTQEEIIDELATDISESEAGSELTNLLYVEGEFILCTDRAVNGSNVDLQNCIRGVLDSAARAHAAGTRVYLMAGGITATSFPTNWTVDIKLLPENFNGILSEAGATTVQVDLDDRNQRPYPASKMSLNNAVHPSSTVDLDLQQGSSEDTKGIEVEWIRRDFRTAHLNEVDASGYLVDEDALPSDFPAANTTEYAIEVRDDPEGSNTLLFTIPYGTAQTTFDALRTQVLKATDGVIPSRMRIDVTTRHTVDSTTYTSREALRHDFDVASSQLSGLKNGGTLDTNEVGSFTADETGTYTFTIGTSLLSSGVLEAQINGGGYSTVISTSGTTGTLAGVTAGDTIDFRHTQTGGGTTETMLLVEAPSTVDELYAILDI